MLRCVQHYRVVRGSIFEGFAKGGWYQDKVFECGYRSETVQDTVDGSGSGLAIAREMITRLGCRIDVLDGWNNFAYYFVS